MPIMSCQKDGKSGHKYGESGHCYTGKDSKERASKQGRAIEASKHAKGKMILSKSDFTEDKAISWMKENNYASYTTIDISETMMAILGFTNEKVTN